MSTRKSTRQDERYSKLETMTWIARGQQFKSMAFVKPCGGRIVSVKLEHFCACRSSNFDHLEQHLSSEAMTPMFGEHVEVPQSHHTRLSVRIKVQADHRNHSLRISSEQQRLAGKFKTIDARLIIIAQTANELESFLERTNHESIQFVRLEFDDPFESDLNA